MIDPNDEYTRKVLGLMQLAPVTVTVNADDGLICIYHIDALKLQLDRAAFDDLSVHDIINKAGVPLK